MKLIEKCLGKRKRDVMIITTNAAAHERHILRAVHQSHHGLGIHNSVDNEILS